MSGATSNTRVLRGDLVQLIDGAVGIIGCDATIQNTSDEVHVDLPVRTPNEPTYTFQDGYMVQWREVKLHRTVGNDGDLARAHMWEMGYRGVDGEKWVLREEEDAVGDAERRVLFPVADEAWDHEHILELQAAAEHGDDANDALCGYEDDGFVVPDDDPDELWTAAPEPSPEDSSPAATAVREMHQAAREWRNWAPSNPQEDAAKAMVTRMESAARHRDDEARFARGQRATSYHPPEARRR